jgi:putative tricarboxylic transport membrane protein
MRRAGWIAAAATAAVVMAAAACSNDADPTSVGDGDAWTPTEPVEYVAPAGTGGGWDTLARTTAKVLEESDLVDLQFPVVNMPGGGGAIGWAYIAGAPGNPHKLFVTSPPIILVPLTGDTPHDHTSFTPIARLITDYMIYAVAADSPIQTIEELFDAIRENPTGFSVAGGSAVGSMDHIAIAGAADAAGIPPADVNYISFEGGGEAQLAALGGHTDAVITGMGESLSMVQSGDIRVLAVSAPERVAALPDVPTLLESGIDFSFDLWRGVMGPPGLTDAQVAYYEQLYADMLELDSWGAERDSLGWIDAYLPSAEFGAFLDEQSELFVDILTDLGLVE